MKVMVLDSGGRGHALTWMFKQDPNVKEVICAPGNVGIILDDIKCPAIKKEDFLRYAQRLVNGFKKKRGISYQGILYLGTMFSNDSLYLLEINVRHGDPEAEVIMPRLKTPLSEICRAIVSDRLGDIKVEWSKEYFCDVVAAAGRTRQIGSDGRNKGWYPGYPGRYGKGYAITGYDQVDPAKCKIFFAGAENHPEKGLITTGGRVLHVVGRGPTLEVARDNAYTEIQKINFEGMRYRQDIGRIY